MHKVNLIKSLQAKKELNKLSQVDNDNFGTQAVAIACFAPAQPNKACIFSEDGAEPDSLIRAIFKAKYHNQREKCRPNDTQRRRSSFTAIVNATDGI
jgi:hypothetical protein